MELLADHVDFPIPLSVLTNHDQLAGLRSCIWRTTTAELGYILSCVLVGDRGQPPVP